MELDFGEGVDSVRIQVLSNNLTDATLLVDKGFEGKVAQPGLEALQYLGEHGSAFSIGVKAMQGFHNLLMDAGGPTASILSNMRAMGANPKKFGKVVISHGHLDHFGGLTKVMEQMAAGSEILVSPYAFSKQFVLTDDLTGKTIELNQSIVGRLLKEKKILVMPTIDTSIMKKIADKNQLKITETGKPAQLAPGVWTSGEIEISDESELTKGLYVEKGGVIAPDDFRHEITIYVKVKNQGLMVLTGCGHTGIANTVKTGQKLSGLERIYAIIGGLHMNWADESTRRKEIEYLKKLDPQIICPLHCSGSRFLVEAMSQMPKRVTQGVVGTVFNL
jgi:7,8-dihydropterin-6-yl-methyl-4-(beta-D-ribofuranosyl)aminobenzene 5'-phosphate synthase